MKVSWSLVWRWVTTAAFLSVLWVRVDWIIALALTLQAIETEGTRWQIEAQQKALLALLGRKR